MSGLVDGRVVIVTGAGRGFGRAHALALAAEGAAVVVNDVGAELDGSAGQRAAVADGVAQEIRQAGGRAVTNTDDVASWAGAERLVQSAVEAFGRLDALVCNAGNLLDRDLADMSERDWDAVIRVHLNGHAAPLHHAARHWQALYQHTGQPTGGRVVLTTSTAGIFPDAGRANYNAAKAGILALGRSAALELAPFGVSVNVIAPYARTRMTVSLDPSIADPPPPDRFDPLDPANVSPLVVWLCSAQASAVTGEVFEIHGRHLGLLEPPARGPRTTTSTRWHPADLGPVVHKLLAARPNPSA